MTNTYNEEETSINESLNLRQKLIFAVDKILSEKIDYHTKKNNNYINNDSNNIPFPINNIKTNQFIYEDYFINKKNSFNQSAESVEFSPQTLNKIYYLNNKEKISKEEKEDKDFLNKKRSRPKIFGTKKIKKKKKLNIKGIKIIGSNIYNFGRKKTTSTDKGKHNKSSMDNIINKIKGHFFHYIRDITKKNSINGNIDFKKTSYKFISNLKKDKNEGLFKSKIKDILSKEPISTKNKKSNKYENKLIIDKIYKEGKELKVIKILELTFNELFIIYRKKLNYFKDKEIINKIEKKINGLDLLINNNYDDIDYLIKDIKKRNKTMNEIELDEYIKTVLNFCCNYEKWFNDKIGRKSRKSKKLYN